MHEAITFVSNIITGLSLNSAACDPVDIASAEEATPQNRKMKRASVKRSKNFLKVVASSSTDLADEVPQ
eukprot:CAMPEP_0113297878 /NCGR_PEP_ID=MMETSP0010_2-20120614/558_1 /TAXON_ID=216773 ORGANISM="Corethron hystrix, Strain 308" /NCGR_SAMPLE_ID=MMETSP0010_2 /ASSEMBLY_ACC=CAM_ASM_000155 /LENGTH=68 /DNA_ID=CAMNT_0000150843 /DNA_START=807 /DNA_END=1013 /DNA_ORIENTATION=+ /assembly_acc=CAM_ASM_000155